MAQFWSLFSAVSVLCSGITFAAQAEGVALSTADCSKLVQHVPADNVTYKSGLDVNGKAVAPADLGGGYNMPLPEEINIQIGVDLADRLALRAARQTPSTPGVPSAAAAPVRKVLPYEGKAAIGTITIKGNDTFWNGERIAPQDVVQLAEACRKGMTAAGVTLPTPKPKP